jgi:hypothetical protein
MTTHQLHLNKGGSGMASMTACGRNILRTPLSSNWSEFKAERPEHQCIKCRESKQFALNTRVDAKRQGEATPVANVQPLRKVSK